MYGYYFIVLSNVWHCDSAYDLLEGPTEICADQKNWLRLNLPFDETTTIPRPCNSVNTMFGKTCVLTCADTYMSLQMYELLGTQCMMTLLLTYCCFTGVRRCTRGQGISWSLYWPPRTCCWAWQCRLPRLTDSPSSGKRRKQIHFSSFFWASVSASFSLILTIWIRSAGL